MGHFVSFMRSPAGRIMRVILGAVLISYGFFADGWTVIGLVGFIPVLAGGFNACLFAPLFGYTVWGEKKVKAVTRSVRESKAAQPTGIAASKA